MTKVTKRRESQESGDSAVLRKVAIPGLSLLIIVVFWRESPGKTRNVILAGGGGPEKTPEESEPRALFLTKVTKVH